jgi:enoyl-CoA hydratase/carnithine racemase
MFRMIELARIVEYLHTQAVSVEAGARSQHHAPIESSKGAPLQPLLLVTGAEGHFCAGADIR